MLQYRLDGGSSAAFAFANAGGIRATINKGPITRGEVLTSFPFSNAVVELEFTGAQLWDTFEGIVSGVNQDNGEEVTSFVQVSKGIKIAYNPDSEIGDRLVSLEISGKDVDLEEMYTVVTIDFLAGGGDNFIEAREDLVVLDTLDEVLVDYIKDNTPIDFELDGRIAVVDGAAGAGSGSGSGTGGNGTTPTDSIPSSSATYSGAGSVGVVSGIVLLVWTALLAIVVM